MFLLLCIGGGEQFYDILFVSLGDEGFSTYDFFFSLKEKHFPILKLLHIPK